MKDLNVLNKRTSAVFGKTFEHYYTLLREFNDANVSKPQVEVDETNKLVYDIHVTDNYFASNCTYRVNGKIIDSLTYEFTVGEEVIISYDVWASTQTDTIIITETGFEVVLSVCDMDGYHFYDSDITKLYLYEGVRLDFFKYVDIEESNVAHMLFDDLVEYYQDKY